MSDDIRQPPAAWYTHPEPNPLDVPNQAVIWHDGAGGWIPISLRYLKETPDDVFMREWFPDRDLHTDDEGNVLAMADDPAGDPMAIADYVVFGGDFPQTTLMDMEWPEVELTFRPIPRSDPNWQPRATDIQVEVLKRDPQTVSPETVSDDD